MKFCPAALPLIAVALCSACTAVEAPTREPGGSPQVAREMARLPPPTEVAKLPAGVKRVVFGVAHRAKSPSGGESCTIAEPLADPPVFDRAPREITYIVELEAGTVKSASTEVVAPSGQGDTAGVNCNAYSVVAGGFSHTQLGNTISRTDKQPLSSGQYRVRIVVNGETAEVPFSIR